MSQDNPFTSTMSHVGVRVSDLDKSTRFYCEGFNFERLYDVPVGNEAAELSGGYKEFSSLMRILRSPGSGAIIELISQSVPKHEWAQPDETRFGLYHISLNVNDIDEAIRRLEAFGGKLIPHRVGEMEVAGVGIMKLAFGTDPDGQIIEFVAQG